ncbi:CHAT domain-containing protein [Apiospora hydei]|uniref:CHAT domain-containing protein n=1 Tax=Apiospora hydei TaxID=1337664 RepID=A0ABR1WL40_9PEZI
MNNRQNRPVAPVQHVRDKMVLISMAQTPGHMPLQYASQEVEVLQLQVIQPLPHREEVLRVVNDCKIFHFAGHRHTNPSDPSDSALVLADGVLRVADLFEVNLRGNKPFLAYLSACGTGQVKHDGLIDEGLHLIGACQLAGF